MACLERGCPNSPAIKKKVGKIKQKTLTLNFQCVNLNNQALTLNFQSVNLNNQTLTLNFQSINLNNQTLTLQWPNIKTFTVYMKYQVSTICFVKHRKCKVFKFSNYDILIIYIRSIYFSLFIYLDRITHVLKIW